MLKGCKSLALSGTFAEYKPQKEGNTNQTVPAEWGTIAYLAQKALSIFSRISVSTGTSLAN
jgi:hypothetical protein